MNDLDLGICMTTTGAKPQGATDEASAARAVREMFDAIAPRYDLLNHVLSANVDRLWWRRAARRFKAVLANPDAAVLDICCGTGDLTMALLNRRPRGATPILAADFARGMLSRGARKFGARKSGAPCAVALEADALHLPLRSASLDLIVTAFGFRNLANYEAGLREFHRVLKPGGQLGILEFSRAGGADRQGLCGLLPARAAGDWAGDLRPEWGVQLPARFGGQLPCPAGDGGADASYWL